MAIQQTPPEAQVPMEADTIRTPEELGRDAIGRTEAQVIGVLGR